MHDQIGIWGSIYLELKNGTLMMALNSSNQRLFVRIFV